MAKRLALSTVKTESPRFSGPSRKPAAVCVTALLTLTLLASISPLMSGASALTVANPSTSLYAVNGLTDSITIKSDRPGVWDATSLGTIVTITAPDGAQMLLVQTGVVPPTLGENLCGSPTAPQMCRSISFGLDGRSLAFTDTPLEIASLAAWGVMGDLSQHPAEGTWSVEIQPPALQLPTLPGLYTTTLKVNQYCGVTKTNSSPNTAAGHQTLINGNNPQFWNLRVMPPGSCWIDNAPTNGLNSDSVVSMQENPNQGVFFYQPVQPDGGKTGHALSLHRWDFNGDMVGDIWAGHWASVLGVTITPSADLDSDGLSNLNEYRWLTVPACLGPITNCQDFDGDSWFDGPEKTYWNNPANDAGTLGIGQVLPDLDGQEDADMDGIRNIADSDSDNDGINDGPEALTYLTFPELPDSDCAPTATVCTASSASTFYSTTRTGLPGSGDYQTDGAEVAAWGAAWSADADADGIPNIRDADADSDGLLDGHEMATAQILPGDSDTENDGIIDGDELEWSADTDGDSLLNANDVDSDADGMVDQWEYKYNFNRISAADAADDADDDGLTNLGEHDNGAEPWTQDTDIDLLLDGAEVNTHSTSPTDWDSDNDAMPDSFEVKYGLSPNSAADASGDPDADFYDSVPGAPIDQTWTNLQEYRYNRPTDYDEAFMGPWLKGTNPLDSNTDDDAATDGFEAFFGTDAVTPNDPTSDQDNDGLGFAAEFLNETDPTDADTDNDGLCDGGGGTSCHLPTSTGCNSGCPGEANYGTLKRQTDTDGDGLSDYREVVLWDPRGSGVGLDTDADLMNGFVDPDSDNDQLSDGFEEKSTMALDPALFDSDADGLGDGEELYRYVTMPDDFDTDNDLLTDGQEVNVHRTNPLKADTDGDTLSDSVEVSLSTDPLKTDTDGDFMTDGWEVSKTLNPLADDSGEDPDADDLSNLREFYLSANPRSSDTDSDGMPDGWEDTYQMAVTSPSASLDSDADGLTDGEEFSQSTHPRDTDSDNEGLLDGAEVHTYGTAPLARDTDLDGLDDYAELQQWNTISGTAYTTNYDFDGFLSNLQDIDADNDGLNDYEEFMVQKTSPRLDDSDGDDLTDYQEVGPYQGRFNPNDPDTDDDGDTDGEEIALETPQADPDQDALTNSQEISIYDTNFQDPDTDCDGALDGPEQRYWGSNWNAGSINHLLTADVDGDTIPDGVELGFTGASEASSNSNPGLADTDGDTLNDIDEIHNRATTGCGAENIHAPMSMQTAEEGPSLQSVLENQQVQDTLVPGVLYRDDGRVHYVLQDDTLWVLGALGGFLALQPTTIMSGPTGTVVDECLGKSSLFDSDNDGLNDAEECRDYKTNPQNPDTDNDKLGDGFELGRGGDADPNTKTDPKKWDTDGDTLADGGPVTIQGQHRSGEERGTPNGYQELDFGSDLSKYCPKTGETSPTDLDTDDDGKSDIDETNIGQQTKLSATCWDSDWDGLSDGLELGTPKEANGKAPPGTLESIWKSVYGRSVPTWQPFQGTPHNFLPTNGPTDPDADDDGILDGLEDWDHNGVYFRQGSLVGGNDNDNDLDPTSKDADKDNLMDSRELRLWSADLGPDSTYNFPNYMKLWSGTPRETIFDVGNLKETNPRTPFTKDGNLMQGSTPIGDGVADGADLNPRGNAEFQIQFVETTESKTEAKVFKVLENIDGVVQQDKKIELEMIVLADLPAVTSDEYDIEIKTIRAPEKDAANFISLQEELKNSPQIAKNGQASLGLGSPIAAMRTAGQAGKSTANVLSYVLDLPDDVGKLQPGKVDSLDLRIKVMMYDDDNGDNYGYDDDDRLDLGTQNKNAREDATKTVDLAYLEDPPTKPLDSSRPYLKPHSLISAGPWKGDEGGGNGDEDAELKGISIGTSVFGYFTDALRITELVGPFGKGAVSGSCGGGFTC